MVDPPIISELVNTQNCGSPVMSSKGYKTVLVIHLIVFSRSTHLAVVHLEIFIKVYTPSSDLEVENT